MSGEKEYIASLERGASIIVAHLGTLHLRLAVESAEVTRISAQYDVLTDYVKKQSKEIDATRAEATRLKKENEILLEDRMHAEKQVEKLTQKVEYLRTQVDEEGDTPL